MANANGGPLDGIRVVDATWEIGELCGRILADLGADVVRAEPPDGSPARTAEPRWGDASLSFVHRNAGKRGVTVDVASADGRELLHRLLDRADVWIDSWPGEAPPSLGQDELLERHPGLVAVSISWFGRTGPYRDYEATEMVAVAMGGMMYRAGVPHKPPLMAPGAFASDVASISAAFAALAAHHERLRSGRGDAIDVSAMESVANLSDWALPIYSQSGDLRHREGSGLIYPVFPCRDGHVRLVLPLSPRQWIALREWLGEPEELMDERFEDIVFRIQNLDVVNPHIVRFFADKSMTEIAVDGQGRGLAVTPLLKPSEVLDNEHVSSRETFVRREVLPGVEGSLTAGFVELDGERLAPRRRAPEVGEHDEEVYGALERGPDEPAGASQHTVDAPDASPPFAGLRVLDLGIGAVGVETGRLFAEYGAEVIKVESRTYPDFIRTVQGSNMNPSFASSSRTKRSFGVDLKTERGLELVHELVRRSDVLIENSATGVMDRIGLGYERIRELNPRLVMVSSQLLGSRGAWSSWSGYGPNTRPVAGLTYLWNHPEDADAPPGVSTIHPDHLVGRLAAIAAVASLVRRDRTGTGGHAEVAQFESVVGMLGDLLLQESLEAGSVRPTGNVRADAAPWGPYPCAGEDEWCVVTVRDDDDWNRFRKAIGDPGWAADDALATAAGRVARREEVDEAVSSWTRERAPRAVMTTLQEAGVPAGIVQHPEHQLIDPHLRERGYLREIDQPPLGPIVLEGPAFHGRRMPTADVRPAPDHGEHTRDVCRRVLELDAGEIDHLVVEGVLEEPSEPA